MKFTYKSIVDAVNGIETWMRQAPYRVKHVIQDWKPYRDDILSTLEQHYCVSANRPNSISDDLRSIIILLAAMGEVEQKISTATFVSTLTINRTLRESKAYSSWLNSPESTEVGSLRVTADTMTEALTHLPDRIGEEVSDAAAATDEDLRRQALMMVKDGKYFAAIALALGISTTKLRKLLAPEEFKHIKRDVTLCGSYGTTVLDEVAVGDMIVMNYGLEGDNANSPWLVTKFLNDYFLAPIGPNASQLSFICRQPSLNAMYEEIKRLAPLSNATYMRFPSYAIQTKPIMFALHEEDILQEAARLLDVDISFLKELRNDAVGNPVPES